MHTYRQFTLSAALAYFVVVAAIYLLIPTPLPAQEAGGGGQPPEIMWSVMKEIARVRPQNHPMTGWLSAELGDINGDGYADFAVSTYSDTTFVYMGGDSISVWQEPLTYVLGGHSGLRAVDVDGDGRIDLVTSKNTSSKTDPDPKLTGRIRVYLNNGGGTYFSDPPDMVLAGDTSKTTTGLWGALNSGVYHGIELIDFNGDSHIDLLITTRDWKTNDTHYGLFLGPYPWRRQPDHWLSRAAYGEYWKMQGAHLVGDINGDGRTDVLLRCVYRTDSLMTWTSAWGVFLGREHIEQEPLADFTLRKDIGWYFDKYYPAIADLNNDGCDEIFANAFERPYGDLIFSYGRPVITSIAADDTLSNPYDYQTVVSVNAVGDLNGDGTRDIMVGYTGEPFLNSTAFHCYPNKRGTGFKQSAGGFGVQWDWHGIDNSRAFPAGDVNGDGYDDVLLLSRMTRPDHIPGDGGFLIYGGSKKLLGITAPPALPPGPELEVYPNPVLAGRGELHIRLTAEAAEQSTLEIHDITGRRVYSRQHALVPGVQQITIQDVTLQPGYYTIVLTGSTRSAAGVVCQ
ncbi:MAG: T9SS type A sorting domain-containing protein [Bacteroidia bacterium]|nr:T9SS type A sorting domain-containing protein [Bacteroidia bacterium]